MSDFWTDRDATLEQVWAMLTRATKDRRAAARHLTLATVGLDGGAEARTVVLRRVDRPAAALEIHTDAASCKLREIAAAPRVTVHVWDPRTHLQIRLRAHASEMSPEATVAIWRALSDAARHAYGAEPPPGAPIAAPAPPSGAATPERFAALALRIDEIETLHLGRDHHRRARFRRADGWVGHWLAP